MNTALRAAFRFAKRALATQPGVFEIHLSPDSSVGLIGPRHVGDFWEEWDYALGEIDVSPAYLNGGQFIGVIHEDGAYLVEVSR